MCARALSSLLSVDREQEWCELGFRQNKQFLRHTCAPAYYINDTNPQVRLLVGRLVVWYVCWLVGWLDGCLVGRSVIVSLKSGKLRSRASI